MVDPGQSDLVDLIFGNMESDPQCVERSLLPKAKFLQQPTANCYIGYMVNNNNTRQTNLNPATHLCVQPWYLYTMVTQNAMATC